MTSKNITVVHSALGAELGLPQQGVAAAAGGKPHVAVIEDNLFTLEAWIERLSPDALVFPFESPEALLAHMAAAPGFLSQLTCVITDYYFDNSEQDGIAVGRAVKAAQPDLPVFLSSDGYFETGASVGWIDRVIVKNPVPFSALPLAVAAP